MVCGWGRSSAILLAALMGAQCSSETQGWGHLTEKAHRAHAGCQSCCSVGAEDFSSVRDKHRRELMVNLQKASPKNMRK